MMEMIVQQNNLGFGHIYKYYKSVSNKPVELSLFRKIWVEFIKDIMYRIIYKGQDIILPSRMGSVGIRKKKIYIIFDENGNINKKFLLPDWKKTKELWEKDEESKKQKKIIYHLNKHSGGYIYRFFWDKRTCMVQNESAYSLVFSRRNKRTLAKVIKDENIDVDYYEQKVTIKRYERISRSTQ